jgi:hypothetical protein
MGWRNRFGTETQVIGSIIISNRRVLGVGLDLFDSLHFGFDDFEAMPSHAIFLCVIYPLIRIFLVSIASGNSMLQLAFPIAAGFALVGPFTAGIVMAACCGQSLELCVPSHGPEQIIETYYSYAHLAPKACHGMP